MRDFAPIGVRNLCLDHVMRFSKILSPPDKTFRAFLGALACLAVHPDCSGAW
jgi:hypothetical protein